MGKYKVTTDDLSAFNELMSRASSGYLYLQEVSIVHPIDPKTGLPSLPEGYFWRVFEEHSYSKIGLFFSEEVSTEVPTLFGFLTGKTKMKIITKTRCIQDYHIDMTFQVPEAAIVEAAENLLSNLAGHLLIQAAPLDLKDYYGDYPPKSILTD